MVKKLYAANIPETVDENGVLALFENIGPVLSSQRLINQRTEEPREVILIEMERDEDAASAIQQLNGYVLDNDRTLFVSYIEAPESVPFSDEMKELAREITLELEETDSTAKRQIGRVIHLGGIYFAKVLLEEAKKVEAAGGIMVADDTRRRTLGGVFFFLARQYLAPKVLRAIFYTKPDRGKPKPKASGKPAPASPTAAPKARSAAPRPAPAPAPLPVEIRELTPEIEQQFAELLRSYADAQESLAALQSQAKPDPSSVFLANKNLWQIENEIRALRQHYPDLA